MRVEYRYTASGRSVCKATRELIPMGALRLCRDVPPLRRGGAVIQAFWSLAGMSRVLSTEVDGSMRAVVDRGVEGADSLREDSGKAVQLALSVELIREMVAARVEPEIVPPAADHQMPWVCSRCGKQYAKNRKWALRHADAGECKRPRPRREAAPVPARVEPEVGRARRGTWLTTTLAWLRTAPGVREAGGLRWVGHLECAACTSAASPCQACMLLQCRRILATDREKWDRLVYGSGDGDGEDPVDDGVHAARRRRRTRQLFKHHHVDVAAQWVDPRPQWAEERLQAFIHGRWMVGRGELEDMRAVLGRPRGRMEDVLEELLHAWRSGGQGGSRCCRGNGLRRVVLVACSVLEQGGQHAGRARALLRVVLRLQDGGAGAVRARRSLIVTALRVLAR